MLQGGAPDLDWFDPEVNRLGVPFWKEAPGPIASCKADGYVGNQLIVWPGRKLVAVRQRRYPKDAAELDSQQLAFGDFGRLVLALVSSPSRR